MKSHSNAVRRRRTLCAALAPLFVLLGAAALHCGGSSATPPGAALADGGSDGPIGHIRPDASGQGVPPGDDAEGDAAGDAPDGFTPTCESVPNIGDTWGPGWRPLPGAPSTCVLAVPVDLQNDVAPVGWIPCTNGMAGCQEATSIDGCGSSFGSYNRVSRGASGEAKWMRFERKRGPDVFEDVVIDVATSATLAAWRYDMHSHCAILAGMGQTLLATVGYWPDGGGYAYGTPPQLMQATPPAFLPLPAALPLTYTSDVAMSDTTLAVAFAFTVRAPLGSSTFSALPSPDASAPHGIDPVVVGDDVFVTVDNGNAGGWFEEHRVDPDGTHVRLRAKPSTHVHAFATDGTTMFWTESYGDVNGGYFQPNVDVWAAPYTADPATLATSARRIATVPPGGTRGPSFASFAFGGIYGFQLDNSATYLVRGADGAMKTVSPGPGRQVAYALLATPTELWSIEGSSLGQQLTRIAYGGW